VHRQGIHGTKQSYKAAQASPSCCNCKCMNEKSNNSWWETQMGTS